MWGIELATDPNYMYMQQVFEQLALSNNCRMMVNGEVNLNDATRFGQIWNGIAGEGFNPDGTGAWLGMGLPDADPGVAGIQPPPCICP